MTSVLSAFIIRIVERMVFIVPYDVFCKRITDIAKQAGERVRFFKEDGKHIARCSGGITIIGNSDCPNVLVKWGSGHTASAVI